MIVYIASMPRTELMHISSPQTWAVVTTPVRFEMVEAMRDLAPCGIRAIAERLGVKPDTLYRHMELLQEAGFVVPAGFRKGNRGAEQLFDLTADDFNISFDSGADPVAANEMLRDTAALFLRRMNGVVRRSAAARLFDTTSEGKNLTLFSDYTHLTRAEFKELAALISRCKSLLDKARKRGSGSVGTRLYSVLLAAVPVAAKRSRAGNDRHPGDNEHWSNRT
jgi:predicted transcriptional regulator